jgi:hypothetical protein
MNFPHCTEAGYVTSSSALRSEIDQPDRHGQESGSVSCYKTEYYAYILYNI